ncbi:RNA exonuclease 5 isoform X1 [Pezoporus flaviventris]|uniref:RNA exonuclease 5 isoform X1 n=1 Tax=Pezoporus flaviventris TaxID=889875 RepID=UPI002AB271AA|nr:RNA exonuclease 5 isoform X1 [Pezoporus flaviventris]XP_061330218.1 RNA exonuclease 5 isoform X1 [Pezoporus flaviventris]
MAKAGCPNGCKRPAGEGAEGQAARKRRKVDGGGRGPEEKSSRLSAALFGEDCEISCDQLYELLKYAALGKRHNATQPSWCRISHQSHLAGVVVIVLHEMSQLHFYKFYLQFKHLRKVFRHRFILTPSANFFASLYGEGANLKPQNTTQGLTSTGSECIQKNSDLQCDPIIRKYGIKPQGLTSYILTLEEQRKNDYPIKGSPGSKGYIYTECDQQRTDSSPLFGLDCEMCLTAKGNEVTRVSLVDAQGQCLLNELVKPESRVMNYLTRFSGVTKKMLLPVKTRLSDIQTRLKEMLPHDAVLVGHSLNADLQALEMIHPSVIDTSLLFARNEGRRFKLKFLAKAVLGKEIQCEQKLGHDPAEDARAALELAQFFIEQGPAKVAELNLEMLLTIEKLAEDSQNKAALQPQGCRVQKQLNEPPHLSKPCFLDCLQVTGQKPVLLGRQGLDSSGLCQSNLSTSNKQILKRALEDVPLSTFSIIQFSLGPECIASHLPALCEQVRSKLTDMLTIYAGPFEEGFCLHSVKKKFGRCGPIQSLTVVTEPYKPYVCIQYEVLEAAQLAVESLNGAEVAGSCIKVQRPVTAAMLDCDDLIKELELDVENEGVIYVAGLKKSLTEMDLQEEFSQLKDLEILFLPKDLQSGKHRNCCFLKFQESQSAADALEVINGWTVKGSKLRSRNALASGHLWRWIWQMNHSNEKQGGHILYEKMEQLSDSEQDLKKKVKKLDHHIKKLYRRLQNNTLCVVLFPGVNSRHGAQPGLGLMAVKDDGGRSAH